MSELSCHRFRYGTQVVALATCFVWTQRLPANDYSFEWTNPTPQGNGLYGMAFEDALTGYAVGDKGTVLRTDDGGQTWIDLTSFPAFTTGLRDVRSMGPGQLLAVGDPPGIFRSDDGGVSWSAVSNPSTGPLFNIEEIPGGTLSVVGRHGAVLHSIDGGLTWTLLPPPFDREIYDQFWWDELHGYVVGSHVARQTDDGGQTWQPIPDVQESGAFTDIQFLDSQNGWLLEHFTTYRTTDGGASWFEKHGDFFESPIYQEEALFIDASRRFVITHLEGAEIWETQNDGPDWDILYRRIRTVGYTDIHMLSDGALVVCSSDGDLLRSVDMGQSWTNFTRSPEDGERSYLRAMTLLPSGKAFAGGRDQSWLRSDDGGETWEIPAATPGVNLVYCIEFLNDDFGLAGGYMTPGHSNIVRTTDGGESWISHELAPGYMGYAKAIAVPEETACFVVTTGDEVLEHFIFYSTDGGETWEERGTGIPGADDVEAICFLDTNVGFAGGGSSSGSPRIWKTVDGGALWTSVSTTGLPDPSHVRDMHWMSETTAVVVGRNGIYRTTNGGDLWTESIPDEGWYLDFYDSLHGVTANPFDEWVWVTADGGLTWEQVEYPWADGPRDVASTGDGFLVCGESSVILLGRGDDTNSVDGQGPGDLIDSSHKQLVRVSPNPTGGRLEFSYQSATQGRARFEIFDVNGRRVLAFTESIGVGPVTIRWDGTRLSAGIYFVQVVPEAGPIASGRFTVLSGR